MSRRLLLLNLVLAAAAAVFTLELVRELSTGRPLPDRPAPRVAPPAALAPAAGTADSAARPDQRPLYNVIAAKSLFSPSRTEAPATLASAAAAAPKPFLHGVVLDDGRSRAYLEDPTTKKVFGYAIGDQVSGGTIETIRADSVVIARPDGKLEVLLRDPSKPKPPAPAVAAGTPGAPRGQPAAAGQNPFLGLIPTQPPASPATPAPTPATPPSLPPHVLTPAPTPGAQTTPTPAARLFQQLAPDFFRRPPPNPYHPELNQPRTN